MSFSSLSMLSFLLFSLMLLSSFICFTLPFPRNTIIRQFIIWCCLSLWHSSSFMQHSSLVHSSLAQCSSLHSSLSWYSFNQHLSLHSSLSCCLCSSCQHISMSCSSQTWSHSIYASWEVTKASSSCCIVVPPITTTIIDPAHIIISLVCQQTTS